MKLSSALSFSLLLATAQEAIAFTPSSSLATQKKTQKIPSFSISPLLASSSDVEESTDDRRGFLTKVLGGAAATGIVANGISVQGPSPYMPPVNSLNDKLIVITGGNTGLGLESAKRLATAGATIVLTSRSVEKGERAVQSVKDYVMEQTGQANDNIYTLPLDLCNLESVKSFPEKLKNSPAFQNRQSIDVLMNNAGVMAVPDLQITQDGYEKTFQSNHLGHFALTAGLEPLLNPNGSRVVNVSSMAHLIASKGLDMENLNGEKDYQPWNAYGLSKLENILFTKELQKRADEAGKKITAVALHPGAVRTDLPRYIVGEDKFVSMQDAQPSAADILKLLPAFYFTKSVDRGASTQIYLSAFQGGSEENVKGKFFFNMKDMKLNPAALDMEKAKDLWKVSEDMAGIKFNL
ncbi:hypothetical protein CTEN210_11477 [Chaetoceros tenuissimus]|uniref:Protochlorophyllide reductase n=1 Tax=Chaetoceros tenuissimus TaxID=426638 RepID=A0AAD3CZG8_9STRA|nr:hypothetical protein CTEN210_11477 [Chaetoceros tenuissimus]